MMAITLARGHRRSHHFKPGSRICVSVGSYHGRLLRLLHVAARTGAAVAVAGMGLMGSLLPSVPPRG